MGGFEILEHTADVGIRSFGDSIEETFEQATRGLAEILGAWRPGDGQRVDVELEGSDLEALLVDWLNEVLYLQDARDGVICDMEVLEVDDARVVGSVAFAPRGEQPLEGTAVKAITYHQLKVERTPGGWVAEVYVDV